MFSRIGVPREVLTDMGAQFTSSLMSEVSRLISFKQLATTPYHPMCNGLVERFNGTLKQMLKRMSAERPRDWDKYLNAVLFAYREVPQESLGFSPFELVYGRTVRGPMMILKELWTKEIQDPQVKSTYQYVIDLRERLENTCRLARDNLQKASKRYKVIYDRKSRSRSMKEGDQVLVLLPTDNNKLLMQWKGPFKIVKKLNKVDYQINMQGKFKTFHANLLKLYTEREPQGKGVSVVLNDSTLNNVSASVIDCSDEQQNELADLPVCKAKEGPCDVEVSSELSPEQNLKVIDVLNSFSDVLTDLPGRTCVLQHNIQLTCEVPVRANARPIPYTMLDVVNEEVDKMITLDIIEPSISSYSSPIVIVKKKDGTNRFCIDFRALNSQTVFDAEPMPDADEIFSKLATHKVFSKLDLTKGYWQVPLIENSKRLTAFQTPKGLFQFRVMPFGLVTASATFSRLMRIVLQGLQNVDNFIDDILIYTPTFEEHLEVLKQLFVRLRNANLTAKPSKCTVAFSKVECLGHTVGNDGISPNVDKVIAIEKAKQPSTKKQLRSFF
ncbi:hypothetical protein FSP39_011202 [Pinctada imbricata]|uniref:Uncharacterized protein n=1 Tax=Pinctada imbricata TaxID=66713 RepID=A0AA89BLW0_PINIB|nr:hypothetical protein FSP39_011202 [Pinctada imbricata]